MSMEIYVLSDMRLGAMADWQKAIDALGFSVVLSNARPIADLGGFLPTDLAGVQTGFECDHWDPREVQEAYADISFGREWGQCLAFRWGTDLKACLAAYMAAAGYAGATKGVVFDCEQGRVLKPRQAAAAARDLEQQLPVIEQALRGIVNDMKPKA
jgi:hypothetical protein